MYALHACSMCGMGMGYFYVFRHSVPLVCNICTGWLSGNYFLELQKIRIFRTLKLLSMCHRSSLNCLLCQYSLFKRTTFVCALAPRDVFRRPCRHCPGSLCCLNPFGTCLEVLLNIPADHSTTVCVLQQPYNQQSPCSATPLWKQRFDIGSTI